MLNILREHELVCAQYTKGIRAEMCSIYVVIKNVEDLDGLEVGHKKSRVHPIICLETTMLKVQTMH